MKRPVPPPPLLLLPQTRPHSPIRHRGSVCPRCPPTAPPYATWPMSGLVHLGGTERDTSPQNLWVNDCDCIWDFCSGVIVINGPIIDPVYRIISTLLIKTQALIFRGWAWEESEWKWIKLWAGCVASIFLLLTLCKLPLFILFLCQWCFSRNVLLLYKGVPACLCDSDVWYLPTGTWTKPFNCL